jgi:Post-segregation antitoxin CcdA
MARVNVYLPDDLAREARDADINVSRLTQEAVTGALAAHRTDQWLDQVLELKRPAVDVPVVLAAVSAALDDLDRGRD